MIYTYTQGGKLTTTDWTVVAEHSFDETDLLELYAVAATNVDGSTSADVNLALYDADDSVVIEGVCPLNVTIGSKDGLLPTPFFGIPPGYKLKAKASAANRLSVWCSGRRTTQS